MIEHSINKYPTNTYTTSSNIIALPQQPSRAVYGYSNWIKLRCENYINLLKERGFKEGAKVVTKWGVDATIEGFRPVPFEGWSFSGQDVPNCMTIRRDLGVQNNIFYNEHELELVQ